jgi:hypothetical protein
LPISIFTRERKRRSTDPSAPLGGRGSTRNMWSVRSLIGLHSITFAII